jgi:membrane-associated protease RseP (regulator of RpoE activity)
MKRIASLSGLLALVFVGCGLISSPPIDNPFGLQGQQSRIDLGPSSRATGNATATVTFNDITLNSPLTPTGFTYNLAISNVQFSGSGCPSSLPTSVAVSANVTITVSDNPTSGPRTASAQATNVQFNLNASGSAYTVSNLTGGSLTFSNLQTLLNILQNGGQNTATLNATVNTTSNPDLAGCTMIITWGGGQGVLKF